jgi:acetyl esterase/lipase
MKRNMKGLLLCIMMLIAGWHLAPAQENFVMEAIEAVDQPGAIALYPEAGEGAGEEAEQWNRTVGQIGDLKISIRTVRNVTNPTITPVLPGPGKGNGAAVIVAPGGAFLSLSIDSEGFEVAKRLADKGIAAFVLKYRLNETPRDIPSFQKLVAQVFSEAASGKITREVREPLATVDALRALELVRSRADEFGIDPDRVGMIGFSAGAMTALNTVLEGEPGKRPAFFGYIYGPMSPVDVPADAPPMFAAIAMNDGLFAKQGFGIVESWRGAGRPVELHAYEQGDHGFGTGRIGTTTTGVMPQFVAWLESRGLLTGTDSD